MALSKTTLIIMTLSITTHSKMTLLKMTINITAKLRHWPQHFIPKWYVTCWYAECLYAECRGAQMIIKVHWFLWNVKGWHLQGTGLTLECATTLNPLTLCRTDVSPGNFLWLIRGGIRTLQLLLALSIVWVLYPLGHCCCLHILYF